MKNCLYFCRFYYALISLCRMDARLFDDEQLKADSIRGWDSIVHFENSPDQAKKHYAASRFADHTPMIVKKRSDD